MLEQAFKSFIKPELNGEGDITFPINWNPNDLRISNLGAKPFKAISKEGKIFKFSSINKGADALKISRKTIDTLLNYSDHFIYCPGIDLYCSFLVESLPLKTGNPYENKNPYLRPNFGLAQRSNSSVKEECLNPLIDYNSLPLGKIVAFDENLLIKFTFVNSTQAALNCGLGKKYYNISRNINKSFVKVTIDGVSMKLLFAQNPLSKGSSKAVVKIDNTNFEETTYSSVNDCVRALGKDIKWSTDFIKLYLRTGNLYENRYKFVYLSDYHESSKSK